MNRNIYNLLRQRGLTPETRDKTALIDGDARMTYAELYAWARNIASYLDKNDKLAPGDRIGIFLRKCRQKVASIFGITGAGNVFVVINNQLKADQIEYILNDCNIKALVTSGSLLKNAGVSFANTEVREIIDIESNEYPAEVESIPFDEICSNPATYGFDECKAIGRDLASIIYTSGSTGFPKGVVLSHDNLMDGAEIISGYLKLGPDEKILSVLPFSFDYGLNQAMDAVLTGSTLVLLNYVFIKDLVKTIEKNSVTVLPLVPHLWVQLINYLEKKDISLNTVRRMTNTGGPVNKKYVLKFKACFPEGDLYLMYGLTEAFRSTYLPPAEVENRPESIGKAIPRVRIMVLNEDGRDCKPGETGELVHQGALVSYGYWGDPERTNAVFARNPFQPAEQIVDDMVVYSGDLVKRDEEGFIYFLGRKDNIVKSFGYRISLLEIERKVSAIKGVKDVVVVGKPDEEKGTRFRMLILTGDESMDLKTFKQALKKELPYYMVPDEVELVKRFPLTPHGKVDRSGLQKQYLAE